MAIPAEASMVEKSPVEIYQMVLRKELKRFPIRFWVRPHLYYHTKAIMTYVLEELFRWNEEDVKKKLNVDFFAEYKLSGLLSAFHGSVFLVIDCVYPNRYSKEDFQDKKPVKKWDKEAGIVAIRDLIENRLKWTEEEIKEKFSRALLTENGMTSLLKLHNDSIFSVLDTAYPNRYKVWELKKHRVNDWNKQRAKEATKWLIEQKLKLDIAWEIPYHLTIATFVQHGLINMLTALYPENPSQAVSDAYPDEEHLQKIKLHPY
ncbi:hypothetical protein PP175_25615 (plasmid) [Aneurinibacillus sp. Ricciae_BoGa-3]|uniref:hypothetical protein n=1 Tax=Aneurinibacillus sp. Ricciae_BoGa-3 TaxID=3022697 RepID=UPI002340EBF4|nr:hypothetical protein [Aneurinibacillus sp. Ricciae_BoGa-3]WCK57448.1 hypothetical protein PP175_25615 [Aneurinibacillus sp. Ricciae_BoGa-3]